LRPADPIPSESQIILEKHHPGIRLLGTGDESFVFTDNSKVYKFFRNDSAYYRHIGSQIRGRFKGCKHLYDVDYETVDENTVFIYDYEPSRSYTGGLKTDLTEMMSEFASRGVVCKDIKPNNLRITPSGLKFIDYGHDIVAYNESDFIAMCLRAFLCMKYWADPQFIHLAQITNFTWDCQHTNGFIDFFNEAYSLYLKEGQPALQARFLMPGNRWMDRMIGQYSDKRTEIHCLSDMSEELFVYHVSAVEQISDYADLFLVTNDQNLTSDLANHIKNTLGNGKSVKMILPNPFFNSGFETYEHRLKSKGLYPSILSHSDPVPCTTGLESKFILVELKNCPNDSECPERSPRNEDYIFIICGRNVPPGIYMRCWHSLEIQRCSRWGAVIIDDASDDGDIDLLIRTTACLHKRVTYVRNKKRKTMLPNIFEAIRNICTNPNSVIITLDMDDALLNRDALCMIRAEYLRGHDVVSSTCLKKGVRILPYEIKFNEPRNAKAGDVWMHIRSFRKYLFDNICENDFKENGEWIEVFNELAFMVPIAEMASDPVQIKAPLYLWEPRTTDDDFHKAADEHTKTLVTSRKPYRKLTIPRSLGKIRPPGMLVKDFQDGDILIIRHAEKENRMDYLPTERGITERGERESELFGSRLKRIDLYLCSEIKRTAETAYCMNKGNGGPFEIRTDLMLNAMRCDRNTWCQLKTEFGYLGILRKWRNGELTGVLPDFITYSAEFLRKMLNASNGKTLCVITHDHMVCFLSSIFAECVDSHVPYMGGFVLKRTEVSDALKRIEHRQTSSDEDASRTMGFYRIPITYGRKKSRRTADPCSGRFHPRIRVSICQESRPRKPDLSLLSPLSP
jgi:broad specificity phosphatase PhoE